MKNGARLVIAIVASAASFVLAVFLSVLSLGGLPEENLHPLLRVSGAVAMIGVTLVFLPTYLVTRAKEFQSVLLYLLPGAIVPALLILCFRPFGDDQWKWMALQAAWIAFFGAIAGLIFWLLVPRGESA